MLIERNGHHERNGAHEANGTACVAPAPPPVADPEPAFSLDHLPPEVERLAADLRQACMAWVVKVVVASLNPVPVPLVPRPVPRPAPGERGQGTKLVRVHREIMAHASTEPLPSKVVIKRAGYEVNSYSRQAVTDLIRAGQLVRLQGSMIRLA